ncbi:MAG: WYL domain-containing protein [Clostridia bacterium]|nr:WYL domain-containing protein [Clostridia bacterium]
MKSSRLFHIIHRLLRDGRTTAPALARELEVSVRTIHRDVEALCEAGVPILTEQGRGGGLSLMEGFALPGALMTPEEQAQLLLAVKSAGSLTGTDASGLMLKLGGLFRRQGDDWLSVDLSRWGCRQGDDRRFRQVQQAILQRQCLTFVYTGANGESSRTVRPARLVYKASAWYLQGFCLSRQAFRTFKLSRIRQLTVTDETFEPLPEPPPIESFSGIGQDPEVVLRFPASLAFRVYDEFDGDAIRQESDGSLTVTARMPINDGWLYGYLMSFGGAAQVIAPAQLKAGLAIHAKRMAALYEKDLPAFQNKTEDVMFDPVCCDHPHEGQMITQEDYHMEQKFCQSCGMPLGDRQEVYGTEKDGSLNRDYCIYCYKDGSFTGDMTMEEMIEFCIPFTLEAEPGKTREEAKAEMERFFPMLKRWAGRKA